MPALHFFLLDYRLADRDARQMSQDELAAYLDQAHIMRIALIDHRDSHPIVHPVWYYYEAGKFFVATDRNGIKAESLRQNPRLYFLVDSDPADGPPRGVRGKAEASVVDDPDYATRVTLRNVIRYLGSAEGNAARKIIEMGKDSSVIEINPSFIATWKY